VARRRAAVLGAGDVELLPQGGEQVRVLADLDVGTVEREATHSAANLARVQQNVEVLAITTR
jgi:hypothetical protein